MARREEPPRIPSEGEIPIGAKIRALRWYRGLTLSEMARALDGYSTTHVSHIETGSAAVTVPVLEKVAQLLETTPERLGGASREQVAHWIENEKLSGRRAERKATARSRKLAIGQRLQSAPARAALGDVRTRAAPTTQHRAAGLRSPVGAHAIAAAEQLEALQKSLNAQIAELQRVTASVVNETAALWADGLVVDASVEQPSDKSSDNAQINLHGDASLAERYTILEGRAGPLWVIKGGLPADILPKELDSYRQRRLDAFPETPEKERLDLRIARARLRLVRLERWSSRYLIPRRGLVHYARTGRPKYQNFEALDPNWQDTPVERIGRLETVVELLQHPRFELGLLGGRVPDVWYHISNHDLALIEMRLGGPLPGNPFNGLHETTRDPEVIGRLEQNFQALWDELSEEWKDKDRVTRWVTRLIDDIRRDN